MSDDDVDGHAPSQPSDTGRHDDPVRDHSDHQVSADSPHNIAPVNVRRFRSRRWLLLIGLVACGVAAGSIAMRAWHPRSSVASAPEAVRNLPLNQDQSFIAASPKVGPMPVKTHHRFLFHNPTDTSLTISKTDTTCACTRYEFSSQTFAPGESGWLDMVVTHTFSGPKTAQVKVQWSDGTSHVFEFTSRALATTTIGVTPRVTSFDPEGQCSVEVWVSTLDTDPPDLQINIEKHSTLQHLRFDQSPWMLITRGRSEVGISSRYSKTITMTLEGGGDAAAMVQPADYASVDFGADHVLPMGILIHAPTAQKK